MRYGIFDQESGNLIETFADDHEALAYVAEMATGDQSTFDVVNVVVINRGGKTVNVWDGDDLRDAIEARPRDSAENGPSA